MGEIKRPTRRDVLAVAAAAVSGVIATPALVTPAMAARLPAPAIVSPRLAANRRTLSFHHLHTGESLDLVYWAEGRYLPDAAHRINYLLRDFRTADVHPIDRQLLDLLAHLHATLRSRSPFQVISGYRSPQTNAMLQATTEGVATNSLHLSGRAIDIRLPDRSLANVHRVALGLKSGGVGYYPRSDFIHVDVGPVRRWS